MGVTGAKAPGMRQGAASIHGPNASKAVEQIVRGSHKTGSRVRKWS